jgi:hypothetical protein
LRFDAHAESAQKIDVYIECALEMFKHTLSKRLKAKCFQKIVNQLKNKNKKGIFKNHFRHLQMSSKVIISN